MGRFERSLALAKQSYAVLRSNPQLTWFPVVSSIFTVALTISFMLPLYLAMGPKGLEHADHLPPLYYVVLGIFYLCSYFVVIFFNVALVSCAYATLRGEPTSFGEGLKAAAGKLPAILGWTFIAATVGLLLQMVSERSGAVGKIVVAIVGGAWNLITFFVVPIIAIEQGSPVAAVKKSTAMLRQTWGERAIGAIGMGFVFFLLFIIAFIPIVLAFAIGGVVIGLITLAAAVLYWLVLATISASLSGIYRTALYVYAESGTAPSVYSADLMQNAFGQRKPGMMERIRNR